MLVVKGGALARAVQFGGKYRITGVLKKSDGIKRLDHMGNKTESVTKLLRVETYLLFGHVIL